MLDSFGRQIRYLRVSVTDKCNLACAYCKPRPVPKLRHEDVMSIEQLVEVVEAFRTLGVDKVRVTGGEPLVRHGVVEFVRQVAALGCNTVMTTNGTLLAGYAGALKEAGLKRVNISLDTLDDGIYREVTGGGNVNDVLDGVRAAEEVGFSLRLNAVLQKGVNDDIMPLVEFAEDVGAQMRFIELMPFRSTTDYFGRRFVPSAQVVEKYKMDFLCRDGNVEYYKFNGHTVGFISPLGRKFCDSCDRMRLTSTGQILPCLHSEKRFDVRPYLGNREQLTEFLRQCINEKPQAHRIEEGVLQSSDMGSIGG